MWKELFETVPEIPSEGLWKSFLSTDTLNIIIIRKEDNAFCGFCGIQQYAKIEEPELSIELVKACQHQGIGTTVMPMLMNRFFEITGTRAFISKVFKSNTASLVLMHKIGGILLGTEHDLRLAGQASAMSDENQDDDSENIIDRYKESIYVFRHYMIKRGIKMYVIMDLEWIDCCGITNLTQIAALRVDEHWNRVDLFSSLIRPFKHVSINRNHIACTGADEKQFLKAPSAEAVMRALFNWLHHDDVLLWWSDISANVFEGAVRHIFGGDIPHPVRLLYPSASIITGISGSAYKIAEKLGLEVPHPQHVSANDAEAARAVMAALLSGPEVLIMRPWRKECRKSTMAFDYYYDHIRGCLHSANGGCDVSGIFMQGFTTIRSCIKKSMKPCPVCCRDEYRKASAKLTEDMISKSKYAFYYHPASQVFHTAECVYTRRIPYISLDNAPTYEACIERGKRPCKLCKPYPQWQRTREKPDVKVAVPSARAKPGSKQPKYITRKLSEFEKRAYKRHVQAKYEREALTNKYSSSDFGIRTSSAYAFWAGKGYSTFHLHSCPKLNGISDIRGYAKYNHAVKDGLKPCRHCHPTAKNDLIVTATRDGDFHSEETTELLDRLCESHGYAHKLCEAVYYITTPVGKWRLHIKKCPVELWHINLVKCRNKTDEYHHQPKLLLSLSDTFYYIHDHDRALLKKRSGRCVSDTDACAASI